MKNLNNNEEIHKDLEEIKDSVTRIKRYIFWSYFWNWVKVGVAVLIIVLGYVYLPQFLTGFRDWLIELREAILPK